METKDAALALGALAQERRLALFRRLVIAGAPGMTPTELCAEFSLAAPTLSFHLKTLTAARLVSHEAHGRQRLYRANFARTADLVDFLTAHCCGGTVCEVTPGGALPTSCAAPLVNATPAQGDRHETA
jgi:DNA-binding transcriptional ArsR family regulator